MNITNCTFLLMTILLRRITFLGLSHVSDSSESSYVAKDNMTFSGKLMEKSLEGLLHFETAI